MSPPSRLARRTLCAAVTLSALLPTGLVSNGAHAAEMPYVAVARGEQSPASTSRLIITTSAKVELVMLVAAQADLEGAVTRPRADNELGRYWLASSRSFGYEEAPRRLRRQGQRQRGLRGDRLLEFALYLSDPPTLERILPWPESLLNLAEGDEGEDPADVLDRLRREIQEFGAKMRFDERLNERRGEYERLETALRERLAGQDPLADNSAFWGVQPDGDIYLVLSPLISGGYLTSLPVAGRTHHVLAFGPAVPATMEKENLIHHLTHHELSHPLIDRILEKRAAELASSDALLLPMASRVQGRTHTWTWTRSVGEHLLRAYNILELRHRDPVLAELSVTTEEANGFIYTREFVGILDEYAAHRDRWPGLDDFFPTLVTRLDGLAGRISQLDPASRAAEFQLLNPGFEQAGEGWMIKRWSLVRAGDLPGSSGVSLARVARDTGVAHGGEASLRIRMEPSTTGLVAVEQGPLAVRAGGTVRVSAHVKADNLRREGPQQEVCGLYVLFLDRSGAVLSRGETDSAVGTLDWTQLSGEFVAPAGTVQATLGVLLAMSGTAWFDDLKFERVD
jgi:hypothetical protein